MKLKLTEISHLPDLQVRAQTPEETISRYVDALHRGETLPPVDVFKFSDSDEQYHLADGFARYAAHHSAGKTEIEATIHTGTFADAINLALANNRKHGQTLNERDWPRAIKLAFEHNPNDTQQQIAERVGCTQGYVAQVLGGDNITSNIIPLTRCDSIGRQRPRKYKPRAKKDKAPAPTSSPAPQESTPKPKAEQHVAGESGQSSEQPSGQPSPSDPEDLRKLKSIWEEACPESRAAFRLWIKKHRA